jgi:hypothetical protein
VTTSAFKGGGGGAGFFAQPAKNNTAAAKPAVNDRVITAFLIFDAELKGDSPESIKLESAR